MQATLKITNADENLIAVIKSVLKLCPQAKLKVDKKDKGDKSKYEFVPLEHSNSAKRYNAYTPKQKAEARAVFEAMQAEVVDED